MLLDCLGAPLPGSDADAVLKGQYKDFSVADTALGAGPSRLHDGLYRRFDKVLVYGDLKLHLADKVDGKFVATVGFGLALLPPRP